jgi:hypothetical protein
MGLVVSFGWRESVLVYDRLGHGIGVGRHIIVIFFSYSFVY